MKVKLRVRAKMNKRLFLFFIALLAVILFLILSACANPRIVTQKVYVPIRCDISMPPKLIAPSMDNQIELAIELIKNNLVYTKKLESALKFCIGEDDGK